MTGTSRSEQTRYAVFQLVVMAVVAVGFVLVFSLPGEFERMQARQDAMPLVVLVIGFLAGPLGLIVIAVKGHGSVGHPAFPVAFLIAGLPGLAATIVHRYAEPDPSSIGVLRAISVVAVLAVILGFLLIAGRRHVELDRLLFTEATSVAFFATLVVAGGYAALETHADLPRLSFAWVPVIGLVIWGISALVFKRRVS